jgi:hypothetical protein
MNKVLLTPAKCALDMGDGSERGLYVNQDYILQKLKKVHRGISLMYTYYPNDKEWPTRACEIDTGRESKGAWDSPYENYFPYRGGREGLRDGEPFNFMKEIRRHGMDVVLTLTIDPHLKEEDIIPIAKDLRPYGRLLLRVNHECTGDWFCYTRRATYQEIADFFVMCCRVMHKYAPNVKMILCAGMYMADGKLEMEDIFLEAHKAADIWSGDNYLSLHWGWPNDLVSKDTHNYARYSVKEVYEKCKLTYKRLHKITGQKKPMVLSELNADGDVAGPFAQSNMMKEFMELLQADKEKWLSAFTYYQFRDDGRLGLEVTDPNNSEVGIEQPVMGMYREQLHREFFSQKIKKGDSFTEFPLLLRWGGAEDAEGVEDTVRLSKTPVQFELHFPGKLEALNMLIEFNGWHFYKAPGTKLVDLMPYFYDKANEVKKPAAYKIRYFLPPSDGMNRPQKGSKVVAGADPYTAKDGDWLYNYYAELPALPEIVLQEKAVCIKTTKCIKKPE